MTVVLPFAQLRLRVNLHALSLYYTTWAFWSLRNAGRKRRCMAMKIYMMIQNNVEVSNEV
jgi:hypothetical protein